MNSEMVQRPKWQIDEILESLVAEEIRVSAARFSPNSRDGQVEPWIEAENLILPDNSRVDGLPVYFEGKLNRFMRTVGVVYVMLDALAHTERSSEGIAHFRGSTAVILRGPATVQLAWPFSVERLPRDSANYWNDLRVPCAQFVLMDGK